MDIYKLYADISRNSVLSKVVEYIKRLTEWAKHKAFLHFDDAKQKLFNEIKFIPKIAYFKYSYKIRTAPFIRKRKFIRNRNRIIFVYDPLIRMKNKTISYGQI